MATGQSLIDEVARSLNDSGNVRWPIADLLEYLNDALRSAVLIKPEINPVTKTDFEPVAGTCQTLPEDGFALIDVVRNLVPQAGGTYNSGLSISPVSRKELDSVSVSGTNAGGDWHQSDNEQAQATAYVYDIRNRRTFYLFPPQPAQPDSPALPRQIEIVYSQVPPVLVTQSADIGLEDIYRPALIAYMLHRAYAREIPVEGQGADMTSVFYQKFVQLITGKTDPPPVRIEATEMSMTQ